MSETPVHEDKQTEKAKDDTTTVGTGTQAVSMNGTTSQSAVHEDGSAETGEQAEQVETEHASEGSNKADSEHGEQSDSTTITGQGSAYTARFAGLTLLFAVLTATGLITFHPAALAAAGALLIFLAAGLVHTPTAPADHLTATYTLTPERPRPGEPVTVELDVTNTSDITFTDIRLIDTVPEDLRVTGGSPRGTHALRPGETLTVTYEVLARRGAFTFGPPITRTRTLMGTMWVQETLPTDTPPSIRCAVHADDIPLEEQATHYIGRLLGDNGGDGVEFYKTREYHRGDSPSRINWRELAKRGELSTITYREQQAANLTVISDARMWSRVSAGPGTPSAAMLSIYAGYQLTSSFINQGHYVGMVVPGLQPRETEQEAGSQFPYRRFEHGNSPEQQHRAFDLINDVEQTITTTTYSDSDTVPLRELGTGSFKTGRASDGPFDVNPYQVTVNEFVHDLTAWASQATQFIFISPLLDDGAHGLCTQLHNMGFPVIVISPDITSPLTDTETTVTTPGVDADETETEQAASLSNRLLTVQRAIRIESLRQNGVTVIDWASDTPLSAACQRQTLPGGN